MQNVINYMQNNLPEIIFVFVILLLIALYLFWKIKEKGFRKFIIDFIVIAEQSFAQGKNEEKMNFVIDKIINMIPLPFSLIITRSMLKNAIQKVFNDIKFALDYQPKVKEEIVNVP